MWRVTVGPMFLQSRISDVFKECSQVNLALKRESLHRSTRKPRKCPSTRRKQPRGSCGFVTVLVQRWQKNQGMDFGARGNALEWVASTFTVGV